ncbi:hypothetical protein ES705_14879 [subsurface metagenome]
MTFYELSVITNTGFPYYNLKLSPCTCKTTPTTTSKTTTTTTANNNTINSKTNTNLTNRTSN